MRQRRRAAEQREHQREEVELVDEVRAAHALERRAAAGHEDVAAAGRLRVVDGRRRRRRRRRSSPSSRARSRCPGACVRNASGPSGPVGVGRRAVGDVADRAQVACPCPCPAAAVDERRAVRSDGEGLRPVTPAVVRRAPDVDDPGAGSRCARRACPSIRRLARRAVPRLPSTSSAGSRANGAGDGRQAAAQDHHGQDRAEDDQQRPLDELHPGRRDHARP